MSPSSCPCYKGDTVHVPGSLEYRPNSQQVQHLHSPRKLHWSLYRSVAVRKASGSAVKPRAVRVWCPAATPPTMKCSPFAPAPRCQPCSCWVSPLSVQATCSSLHLAKEGTEVPQTSCSPACLCGLGRVRDGQGNCVPPLR